VVDEHVSPQRGDALVVLELVVAVVRLGVGAQNLED